MYLEEPSIVLGYHSDEWYSNQGDHSELPGELDHEDYGANKLHHVSGRGEVKPHNFIHKKKEGRAAHRLIASLVPSCTKNVEGLVSFLTCVTSRVERW